MRKGLIIKLRESVSIPQKFPNQYQCSLLNASSFYLLCNRFQRSGYKLLVWPACFIDYRNRRLRGRTLDDAFIILDEAQNTTPEQMKMFLTRMGVGSKVVVTGDVTQVDLPEKTRSGLVDALHILKGIDGIAQVYLTEKDVVRHELVQRIVKAYAEYENKKGKGKPAAKPAGKRLPTRRKEGK